MKSKAKAIFTEKSVTESVPPKPGIYKPMIHKQCGGQLILYTDATVDHRCGNLGFVCSRCSTIWLITLPMLGGPNAPIAISPEWERAQ